MRSSLSYSLFSSHATFVSIHLVMSVSHYIVLFYLSLGSLHFKETGQKNNMALSWEPQILVLVSDLLSTCFLTLRTGFSHLSVNNMYQVISKFPATPILYFWFLSRDFPPLYSILKNKSCPPIFFYLTSILIKSLSLLSSIQDCFKD